MKLHSSCDQDAAAAKALMSISGPVFAALYSDEVCGRLLVHASGNSAKSRLRSDILQALARRGFHDVRVVFHNPEKLASASSLESFTRSIKGGRIVHDPTGAIARARALVQVAHELRNTVEVPVRSFFYAPHLRSLIVVLHKPDLKSGKRITMPDMAGVEGRVIEAVGLAFARIDGSLPSVRVGFSVPRLPLVPVDRRSTSNFVQRIISSAYMFWKPAAFAALFGIGSATSALAQDAAVSEPNFKLKGSFGEVIDDYTWSVEGAFTAPIGERFGFAIDAGYAEENGGALWGAGGHLFARDPEAYLLGLFAAYVEGNQFDIDVTRVGGEFELYFDDVTLGGHAGYQFSTSLGDKAVGGIDLKWYATENFALTAGAFGDEDHAYGRGRLEWQPGFAALPGLAFNVDGVIGDDDYHSVMGGLTYYFGTPVSLKDRHRRQDPESSLFAIMQTVDQERARLAAQYGPNQQQ